MWIVEIRTDTRLTIVCHESPHLSSQLAQRLNECLARAPHLRSCKIAAAVTDGTYNHHMDAVEA